MTLIMSTREMVPKPSCSTSPTLSPTIRSCHSCPLSLFTQKMDILACFFQPTKRKSYQNWVDHRPLPLFSRWWKEMVIWVGFVSCCTCKSPILLSWLVGHILGNLVSKRNAWPSTTIYWWLIASKFRTKCRRYQMSLWLQMVDIALLISFDKWSRLQRFCTTKEYTRISGKLMHMQSISNILIYQFPTHTHTFKPSTSSSPKILQKWHL